MIFIAKGSVPEILAEPVNVFTNLAFLVVAFAAWLIACQRPETDLRGTSKTTRRLIFSLNRYLVSR